MTTTSSTTEPQFDERIGHKPYLLDKDGNPKVFTTRYSAIAKVGVLKANGHNVELVPGNVFYKIIKVS